jgi:hypothetical protein
MDNVVITGTINGIIKDINENDKEFAAKSREQKGNSR